MSPAGPVLLLIGTTAHMLISLGHLHLQVGYGAFPLSIVEYLWRAKQPYNVSAASEVAACAALTNMPYLEVSHDLELTCDHAATTLLSRSKQS